MFIIFQEPCCIEFYNAYDSILKNIGFHMQFFSFLKTKFDKIQSTRHAHKAVIEIFIELIMRKMFSHRGDGCLRFSYPMPSDFPHLSKQKFSVKSHKNVINGMI